MLHEFVPIALAKFIGPAGHVGGEMGSLTQEGGQCQPGRKKDGRHLFGPRRLFTEVTDDGLVVPRSQNSTISRKLDKNSGISWIILFWKIPS